MQFKALFTLGLIGFAAAAPKQQASSALKDLTDAINGIATALNAFDASVKTLTPTSDAKAATTDLTAKSAAILAAIKSGTENVKKSDKISLTEAIQLAPTSQALTKATQTAIEDLISKKDIIVKNKQGPLTLKQLQDQKPATATFIEELTKKLPSAVSGIAQSQAAAATAALQKGITEFGGK